MYAFSVVLLPIRHALAMDVMVNIDVSGCECEENCGRLHNLEKTTKNTEMNLTNK